MQVPASSKMEADYPRAAHLTFKLAASCLTKPLDEADKIKISIVFDCMGLIDRRVDNLRGEQKKQECEKIVRFLAGVDPASFGDPDLDSSLHRLRAVLDTLPALRKAEFLRKAENIFACGDILSATRTVREFIKTRAEEGRDTADLVMLLVDRLCHSLAFTKFYRRVATTSAMLDSLEDARQDAARGEIVLRPAVLYFPLAATFVRYGISAVWAHPHKSKLTKIGLDWFRARHVQQKPALS